MRKKGTDKGTDVIGPVLLNIGLKVMHEVLVVVGRAELEDAVVGTLEGLDGKRPSLLLLCGAMKMCLNMRDAEDSAGATEADQLADGVLSIRNRTLGSGCGMGQTGLGIWQMSQPEGPERGNLVELVTGILDEAGISSKKVTGF